MITGVNPNPKRMSLTMTQTLMGNQSFSSAARPAAAAAGPNGCPQKDPRALVAHSVGPPKPYTLFNLVTAGTIVFSLFKVQPLA
jgi:hypothetical protein